MGTDLVLVVVVMLAAGGVVGSLVALTRGAKR